MKRFAFVILFFFSLTVFAQEQAGLKVLNPAEYEQVINKDSIQFIDVRTPEEYAAGAIEGAENVNFLADDFLKNMEKYDRNQPVYIYCRSGNRSAKAAAQLSEIGFKEIVDLKGGYKAWTEFAKKE